MSTSPLMCLTGPLADGWMSKSKISVGNQSVAHELGMSTTPPVRVEPQLLTFGSGREIMVCGFQESDGRRYHPGWRMQ